MVNGSPQTHNTSNISSVPENSGSRNHNNKNGLKPESKRRIVRTGIFLQESTVLNYEMNVLPQNNMKETKRRETWKPRKLKSQRVNQMEQYPDNQLNQLKLKLFNYDPLTVVVRDEQ